MLEFWEFLRDGIFWVIHVPCIPDSWIVFSGKRSVTLMSLGEGALDISIIIKPIIERLVDPETMHKLHHIHFFSI